jgi:hypothetical protein
MIEGEAGTGIIMLLSEQSFELVRLVSPFKNETPL